MTLEDLAAKVDMGVAALQKVETEVVDKDHHRLHIHKMRRIAKALKCKPGDLLIDDDVSWRLSDDEQKLLKIYRKIPDGLRQRALNILRELIVQTAAE